MEDLNKVTLNLDGCDNKISSGLTNIGMRRIFPTIVAKDLVGVQPMTAPIGIAFNMMYDQSTENASNRRDMESELNEMDMLIANKNFPFEIDVIHDGMECYGIGGMEDVCKEIYNMKWIVTTGMSKNDYENKLCVKYDLNLPIRE